jgi:hypothetical protein
VTRQSAGTEHAERDNRGSSNLVAEATGDRFPMATLFIALQNDEQYEL